MPNIATMTPREKRLYWEKRNEAERAYLQAKRRYENAIAVGWEPDSAAARALYNRMEHALAVFNDLIGRA